jgi:uncharacterized spore protein YtfJ
MPETVLEELIGGVRDVVTVKRVYGDPYEKNGVTVIPAAAVRAGGGGGKGKKGDAESGGGFGGVARPSGAWVIEGSEVTWKPTVDVNRIVLGGQLVALAAIVVIGRLLYAQQAQRDRSRLEALRAARRLAGAARLAVAARVGRS